MHSPCTTHTVALWHVECTEWMQIYSEIVSNRLKLTITIILFQFIYKSVYKSLSYCSVYNIYLPLQ